LVARLTSRCSNISAKSCDFQRHLENVSGVPQLISSLQAQLERLCAQLYDVGQPFIAAATGVMHLGRTYPEMDAALMFDRDEWQAAYILNKKNPPEKPPTLNEMVRLVTRLGSFLAHKSDGEPGVKTIWLGYNASSILRPGSGIPEVSKSSKLVCNDMGFSRGYLLARCI
jgi:hypothetical protein